MKDKQIEEIVRFIDTHIMAKKIAELIPSKIVSYDGRSKGQHLYIEQKMEIAKEMMKQGVVVWTMDEHAKLVSQVRQEFEHEYKDKVVLSKEEYEKYKNLANLVPKLSLENAKLKQEQKEMQRAIAKDNSLNWLLKSDRKITEKRVSKETAEKFARDMFEHITTPEVWEELRTLWLHIGGEEKANLPIWNLLIAPIAKQFGVQIKE